jgi:hypothetical protein
VEPFTGGLYPVDWLRAEAAKKNIFSLIYQSPDSLNHGLIVPENPFEGVCADPLHAKPNGLCLILKGERCKGERLFWGEPVYEISNIEELEKVLLSPLQQNAESKKDIQDFEKSVMREIKGVHSLGAHVGRLYDRAVLFIDGVGGDSLVEELKRSYFLSYTAAACAWNSPHLNAWLPGLGIMNSWVQSSLIVPLSETKKGSFQAQLSEKISKLRKISGYQVGEK